MLDIDDVTARILRQRAAIPERRSLLVGVSGIDAAGKGYVAKQIEARLALHAVATATINVDAWLNLPDKRFNPNAPAEHFYQSAIRFEELFTELVLPLRDHRSVHLEADFAEETATELSQTHLQFQECRRGPGGRNLSL